MNGEQLVPKAIIFDRDGVLADFDYDKIKQFCASKLSLSVDKVGQLFMELGETNRFPKSMKEEERFWNQFWE